MSWETIEHLLDYQVSDTTLRTRRNEWVDAGVFDKLLEEAQAGYDRIIGLDLADVAIDGSAHKAPCGGEQTGFNPSDRGKQGRKWLVAVDKDGIPLDWVTDGANRNDYKLLAPLLAKLQNSGLSNDVETLHLDRGFGYSQAPDLVSSYGIANAEIVMRNQPKQGRVRSIGLGKRWIVESANSWLTNYGQLRRNTDRKAKHRHAALALATTILITARLIDHRNRWQPPPTH